MSFSKIAEEKLDRHLDGHVLGERTGRLVCVLAHCLIHRLLLSR